MWRKCGGIIKLFSLLLWKNTSKINENMPPKITELNIFKCSNYAK
jgi:hypothetical protein